MTAPRLPATTPEFGGGRATIPPAAPPTTEPAPNNVAHYLSFEPDGSVTVHAGKAEVGQNVRTSLAQAVADELRLPFERVRVLLADTSRVPFDRGTFGSRSTPDMVPRLRRAAAAAREALIDRAAERWEADTSALVVRDSSVVHAETGQALSFVELAPEQRLDAPFDDATATTPGERWTVAGTSAPKPSARDMVTGAHRYASDVSLAGMLYGRVLRPPAYGAHLASVDLSAAQAMSGVVALHEGDFAGVAAPTAHGAARALAMLRAQWTPPAERASDWDLYDALKHEAGETEGGRQLAERSRHEAGSVPDTLRRAKQVLRATYTNAYIAHAPLEPRAAVAEWTDADGGGRLTVWTGTQRPFGVHA
jgi:isoquinoline 1-oxidoreductase